MMKLLKEKAYIILFILGFLFIGFIEYSDIGSPYLDNNRHTIGVIGYSVLVLYWLFSLKRRLMVERTYNYFAIASALLILWILTRTIKYDYVDRGNDLVRYMWLLYYVYFITIPYLTFIAIYNIDKYDDNSLNPLFATGMVLDVLLCAMVLTNDYHKFVFGYDDFIWADNTHTYNFGYYLIFAWIIINTVIALFLLIKKCQVIAIKKLSYIPICVLVLGIIFILGSSFSWWNSFKMAEAISFTYIAIFESCIQVGLIPTNVKYSEFYNLSEIPSYIVDKKNKVVLKTVGLDHLNFLGDENFGVFDSGYQYREAPIDGGKVIWFNDIRQIKQLNEKEAEIKKDLLQFNGLISAENELKERVTRAEVINELYDELDDFVNPRVDLIEKYLDIHEDEQTMKANLAFVALYSSFVKRRSNLMSIAKENEMISTLELGNCFNENVDYSNLMNVYSSYSVNVNKTINYKAILYLYDSFENIIIKNIYSIDSFMINVDEVNQEVRVRYLISKNDGEIIVDESLGYKIEIDDNELTIDVTSGGVSL